MNRTEGSAKKVVSNSAAGLTLPPMDFDGLTDLPSPCLIYFADRIQSNIDQMLAMVANPDRLRPHCKTHKCADIVRILLNSGINHHKAATIAEVEMLAMNRVPDVVLAYSAVGPTIDRVAKLIQSYPNTKITITADHAVPLKQLSEVMTNLGLEVSVLLDLNVGQNRTGIDVASPKAMQLYQLMDQLPGIRPAGFQVYDGHIREPDLELRTSTVQTAFQQVLGLKAACEASNLSVPELLCGGTPSFPVYAAMAESEIRCSPGTCVLHDAGYGRAFPDLNFHPAAAVLTRVISRPASDLMTLDVGNKAIAADPAMDRRAYFPDVPDAAIVGHNEEHMVLKSSRCADFQPGDTLLAIPGHVCPTSALYSEALVVRGGKITTSWLIAARNRRISV